MQHILFIVLLGINAVICTLAGTGAWEEFRDPDPQYGGYLSDFLFSIVLCTAALANVYFIVFP